MRVGVSGKAFAYSLAGILTSLTVAMPSVMAATQIQVGKDHAPGELIVKLKSRESLLSQSSLVNAVEKRLGRNALKGIHPLKTNPMMMVYKLQDDRGVQVAISTLKGLPSVEYVEPNYKVYALDDGAPNDPDFARSWGLDNAGQRDRDGQLGIPGMDLDILPLWKRGIRGSRHTLVAVVDTGIDWNHPDLKANLWTNPGESGARADNGVDDDHNGFVDDVHGWNFVDNNNDSMDDSGHGTHCAGVIGAIGNNGVGTAGINWEVSLMPVKFLDGGGGGTIDQAVNALNYAKLMKARIISASWGGQMYSQALFDAVKATREAGILFVTAAGNESVDNGGDRPEYPASFALDNVVSVAAIDNRGTLAGFSNYGARTVHVAAPGMNIYSTFKDGQWETLSGTSMAAPHVAGVAALLLSSYPRWTATQVKDRLIRTSAPVESLKDKVISRGRVDAFRAYSGTISRSGDSTENH